MLNSLFSTSALAGLGGSQLFNARTDDLALALFRTCVVDDCQHPGPKAPPLTPPADTRRAASTPPHALARRLIETYYLNVLARTI